MPHNCQMSPHESNPKKISELKSLAFVDWIN